MAKLSLVIPAFNEAESLPHLWTALQPLVARYPDCEVIVVNDGSSDNSLEVLGDLHQRDSRVRIISQARRLRKSAALMAGFAAASGEIVVTMDADLQDDPQEIPKMVEMVQSGATDLVVGWKQHRQDPKVKLLSSKVFNGLANRIVGTHFHDLNCGLKVMRREVAASFDLYGDLYRFIPILATANGWRATEVPVVHHARKFGQSKYGLRFGGIFDLITLTLITNYRWRPLHFFGRWGAMFILIGLVILGYLVILHFQGQSIGDRPLLIFGVLFLLTGFQLFFTGLLGDLILQGRKR